MLFRTGIMAKTAHDNLSSIFGIIMSLIDHYTVFHGFLANPLGVRITKIARRTTGAKR